MLVESAVLFFQSLHHFLGYDPLVMLIFPPVTPCFVVLVDVFLLTLLGFLKLCTKLSIVVIPSGRLIDRSLYALAEELESLVDLPWSAS